MKLEIENCKCGGHGCTGKLLILDGSLMDGIHDAETATTLQTAVNLHDELVEALRRSLDFNESVFSCTCNYGGDTCVIHQAKAALAKVERKGK